MISDNRVHVTSDLLEKMVTSREQQSVTKKSKSTGRDLLKKAVMT